MEVEHLYSPLARVTVKVLPHIYKHIRQPSDPQVFPFSSATACGVVFCITRYSIKPAPFHVKRMYGKSEYFIWYADLRIFLQACSLTNKCSNGFQSFYFCILQVLNDGQLNLGKCIRLTKQIMTEHRNQILAERLATLCYSDDHLNITCKVRQRTQQQQQRAASEL